MRHEKIIKREDGSQVKIEVHCHALSDIANYYTTVFYLNQDGNYSGEESLNLVTEQEIQTAKLELWEKLKP